MLLKSDGMWDGRLGETNVVKHIIYFSTGEITEIQPPYRTVPASLQFVSGE